MGAGAREPLRQVAQKEGRKFVQFDD